MKVFPVSFILLALTAAATPTRASQPTAKAAKRGLVTAAFADPETLMVHPNKVREKELFQMMNPLYQLNQMMSPFYRMYGMDPMTAVMHPYLMGNYKNPFLASGASPDPIQTPKGQFVIAPNPAFLQNAYSQPGFPNQHARRAARKATLGLGAPPVHFNPFPDPGFTGNLNALTNPGTGFSNNMPANGVMNPFINTAGMMNPFMNRAGVNPYYALTGATNTMVGSPFNNFGGTPHDRAFLFKLSAMNPFIMGNLGMGDPFLNSGVAPNNPAAPPTDGHHDLGKI